MLSDKTFAKRVHDYQQKLSEEKFDLPSDFKVINPFCGNQREKVWKTTKFFYEKYYDDTGTRKLILGSCPSRRSSAITGVPFEDMGYLKRETGICFSESGESGMLSGFLHDVIQTYGGREKFYRDFYMNFVFPLGIVKINLKGRQVNVNYYEDKELEKDLYSFMIESIQDQIDLGIDRSVCYCIGSGGNYNFLSRLNKEFNFFEKIIPLEHPRFIMQYNSDRKEEFLDKYVNALRYPDKVI